MSVTIHIRSSVCDAVKFGIEKTTFRENLLNPSSVLARKAFRSSAALANGYQTVRCHVRNALILEEH
jgi:hypothetical protein